MKLIIFKNGSNVGIVYPSAEALRFANIEQIAVKDVPNGAPFKIISDTDLPPMETRQYWKWDDTLVPDGYGGESNEF